MDSTHELLEDLDDGDAMLASELSETINETLNGCSIEQRTFYLLLFAVKHHRNIDNPEYSLVDYQLAAESVAWLEECSMDTGTEQ